MEPGFIRKENQSAAFLIQPLLIITLEIMMMGNLEKIISEMVR